MRGGRIARGLLAASACMVLSACPFGEQAEVPEDTGSEDVVVPASQRGIRDAPCGTPGGVLNLHGIFVYRWETASSVSGGNLTGRQAESVVRTGIAQLCQNGTNVAMALVPCEWVQTPILDDTGECAAQQPGPAMVSRLEPMAMLGTLDFDAPGGTLTVGGFEETFGLADGADVPAEPDGAETVESSAIEDSDEDGAPGATLEGSGEVPTTTWAARRTTSRAVIEQGRGARWLGTTTSDTEQTILGGPAARAIRGRVRTGGDGGVVFERADGQLGTPSADLNGDGLYACDELLVAAEGLFGPITVPDCGQ